MSPAQKQTSKAGLALAMAMVGLTLYWAFTYSGPYRHLAELQLKWFRVYYPELTAMVVILGLLGIFLTIKLLFRGAERPVPGTLTVPVNISATNTVAQEPWLRYLPYAVLLVPFGMGGYMYYNGTHAGILQQLNAVDFQSGNLQARVVYTEVRGHLNGPYLTKDRYRYIPMASEENRTGPVQLVVGIDENQMQKYMRREADGTFSVRGEERRRSGRSRVGGACGTQSSGRQNVWLDRDWNRNCFWRSDVWPGELSQAQGSYGATAASLIVR